MHRMSTKIEGWAGSTYLGDGLYELDLSETAREDTRTDVDHRKLLRIVFVLVVDVHLALAPRATTEPPTATSATALLTTLRLLRHVLDEAEDLAHVGAVVLGRVLVLVRQALLANVHQAQRLVDIRSLDDVREAQTRERLREAEHA